MTDLVTDVFGGVKETNSRSAGAATCDASEAAGCRSHACFALRSLLLQFVDSVGFEL